MTDTTYEQEKAEFEAECEALFDKYPELSDETKDVLSIVAYVVAGRHMADPKVPLIHLVSGNLLYHSKDAEAPIPEGYSKYFQELAMLHYNRHLKIRHDAREAYERVKKEVYDEIQAEKD